MKKHILLLTLSMLISLSVPAQNRYNSVWILQDQIINFNTDTTLKSIKKMPYHIANSGSNICNNQGKLKYYSNGCAVVGSNYKVLPHGDTINPGLVYESYCFASGSYPCTDCITILPKPEDTTSYFVFHTAMDKVYVFDTITWPEWWFYYTEINSTLNNGIGDVVKKNVLIAQDTFAGSGIKACRHANGRDWWIVAQELLSTGFHRVLLTSKGVEYKGLQRYKGRAMTTSTSKGQCNFSPNGKKYATGDPYNGIQIFDFDACTGTFSNQRLIDIGYDVESCVGLEFSPNSRFLYVTLGYELRQYDMEATDLIKSSTVIDTVDWTKKGHASLYSMATAPNGKIYMAATHSNMNLHTIHEPNLKGKACGFKQQDFPLATYNYVALPNMPKFRGNIVDVECEKIATDNISEGKIPIHIFPNPTSGQLTIQSSDLPNLQCKWFLFDQIGHQVFSQVLDNESNNVNLPQLPRGIYFWRVVDDMKVLQQGKLVVLE
jgi:hypothetical protein